MRTKTEYDKINDELLEKHFSKQIAEDYYSFGCAVVANEILSAFHQMNKESYSKKDIEAFTGAIEAFLKGDIKTNRIYERLKEDSPKKQKFNL